MVNKRKKKQREKERERVREKGSGSGRKKKSKAGAEEEARVNDVLIHLLKEPATEIEKKKDKKRKTTTQKKREKRTIIVKRRMYSRMGFGVRLRKKDKEMKMRICTEGRGMSGWDEGRRKIRLCENLNRKTTFECR